METKTLKRIIIISAAALIAITFLIGAFKVVPAGHTGVMTTFGKISSDGLSEGLHFKWPFVQKIVLIDNRVQKAEVSGSAASKDLQTVTSTIAINYKVLNGYSTELYQNVGKGYQDIIINPAIQECVKAVAAKYTAEELITNRQTVSEQMRDLLSEKVSGYGIDIQIFNIINFDFSAEYNAAIEAKQTAQQNALKAEQDLQRVRVEAEQKIAQAQAEAEAYKLKSQEITQEILMQQYIEKWDGKLPTMMFGDSNASFMLDFNSLMEQTEKNNTATTVIEQVKTEETKE